MSDIVKYCALNYYGVFHTEFIPLRQKSRLWTFPPKLQLPSATAGRIGSEWRVCEPRGMEAEALKLSA